MSPWLEIAIFIAGGAAGFFTRPLIIVRGHSAKQRHDARRDLIDRARTSKRSAERRAEQMVASGSRGPVAPAQARNKIDNQFQKHAIALRSQVSGTRHGDLSSADQHLALRVARAIEAMAKRDPSEGFAADLADLRSAYDALLHRRRLLVRWHAAKRQRDIEGRTKETL